MVHRSLLLGAALAVLSATPAVAAPELTISATHARETFLRSTPPNTTPHSGTLTLTVRNAGADGTAGTVTVANPLPAGLTALINNPALGAGPVPASGPGWTCAGTTCTRADALAPGASYPPITITVNVANSAAATLTSTATVSGGGDETPASATDTIPVAADACPNGWPREALNPERADGCSLLDLVWQAGPFASQAAFEARVREVAALFAGADADAVIAATPDPVGGIDNSCADVVAFTFDDGPSAYRPQTLAAFRAQGVPATFFNLAVRTQANPQIDRFSLAEGHKVLLHSYEHPRLTNLSPNGLRFQVEGAAAIFAASGAPLSHNVLRAPFGGTNAAVNEAVAAMGYVMDGSGSAGTLDFDPTRTAAQIRDAMIAALRPGRGLLLHDGPIDTAAGQAVVEAIPQIIDEAQARGYCFGVLDETGRVVSGRYVDSGQPIPQIANPVPYIPIAAAYPGTPPSPYFIVPQPLKIAAAHAPAVFVRGAGGTITLTVSNPTTDTPTDDNPTVVTHAIPAGLTATNATGEGWTCGGTATVTCTRSTVLAPGASLPPITIAVAVAADAPAVITTAPRVTGRGGNVWVHATSDTISTATPVPGEVGGTVPPTLSLTLGAPASFGAFAPGVAREYTATQAATVTSTAGEATLSVNDPSPVSTGQLVNGAFALAQPLTPLGVVKTYAAPVSNDPVTITFKQAIGANEALRTGVYAKTLVFTLSATTP
jgi:peptidoglycan/xylan/chitin deacetylase (PgdA/CDA1 family)